MAYPVNEAHIKQELSEALSCHVKLLRNVHAIEPDAMDAFTFMMRSFGFILERLPKLLLEENIEETYFGIFQYYNLLAELKRNVQLVYPYATINEQPLLTLLEPFPTEYQKEINQWWEDRTGLKVDQTKQTITM